jgi:hypothetical protein
MRRHFGALCAAAVLVLACAPIATAHPIEEGEFYVPWSEKVGNERALDLVRGSSADDGARSSELALVGNADKDGTVNTDLAFNGNLVYAGNYSGFRILNASGPQPSTVVDFACNGPQNDVSFHRMGGKTFLFQSIDSAQTAEDCSSVNAPIVNGGRVGYEGVRVFDVTNPAQPQFVDMIQTACGSHTHTLIPDGRRAYIYVSSYPLAGSSITPDGATGPGDYRPCRKPHKKISIIEVSAPSGDFEFRLKEQPLADDTTSQNGFDTFQACHDIQILGKKDIALASCAGDGQLWDVSDPWNPTTNVPGKYTLIKSPGGGDTFEFIHSGIFSWDGKTFAMMDETGGGGTANCFGDATTDGFYYFYKLVKPGKPAPQLEARYSIPRPQGQEVCVSHNASVIPVKHRNLMTASYYQGGVTVVDFTDLDDIHEVAFADLEDTTGQADEWSSYWYNGRIFSNSGLNRRASNRGVDVFQLTGSLGRATRNAERWSYSNPQTQEAWQAP